MPGGRNSINLGTVLPVSLVIALLGMAVAWGVMTQKVSGLSDDMVEVRSQLTELSADVNRLIGATAETAYNP